MRAETDIHRAHDILTLILSKELPVIMDPDTDLKPLIAAADVLCWVLEHDHNKTFAGNLERLEQFVNDCGIEFTSKPEP